MPSCRSILIITWDSSESSPRFATNKINDVPNTERIPMPQPSENHSSSASLAAKITLDAFDSFNAAFKAITHRAKQRFERRDWRGGLWDAAERLDLYNKIVDYTITQLDSVLLDEARDVSLWTDAKQCYAKLVDDRYDVDRAETFFNSITRQMLMTVGVNRTVEFFYLHPKPKIAHHGEAVYRTYNKAADTQSLIRNILKDVSFNVGYENIERDAESVAQEVDLHLWPIVGTDKSYTIEVVRPIFFRNKEAYIVGRIVVDARVIPLIIPLSNGETGIYADTVLLHESEASVAFSFAYSYFAVDTERYDALIDFLRTIIPHAALADLYNSLGYNRHGKTEFYRDLHRFVHVSKEQFIIAPGLEGAVMIAFTLHNFDFVLKIIKDKPCFLRSQLETHKVITKEQVRYQYDFVSHRDRAGRMVDTQEFENLRFKKKRFSDVLLAEFVQAARNNVVIDDEYVIIQHVYVQRKVVPLPHYFQCEKNPEAIRHVLIDFGYFLKDLAASGVFPCDLFNTWNYGVTNWGRVVLYDYDDVLPIERIRFREKPAPRDDYEETEPEENWILATEEDFFMDEIDRFSGIPLPLKGVFKSMHGDLYTLGFWNSLTDRLSRGEIFDVTPYDRAKRFRT
jgi:isocitrate dehydrogenase kinase/phosphatase